MRKKRDIRSLLNNVLEKTKEEPVVKIEKKPEPKPKPIKEPKKPKPKPEPIQEPVIESKPKPKPKRKLKKQSEETDIEAEGFDFKLADECCYNCELGNEPLEGNNICSACIAGTKSRFRKKKKRRTVNED